MKMYGKYDSKRVRDEIRKIDALQLDDLESFIEEAYDKFLYNIKQLKKIFPYRMMKLSEIEVAPYGIHWTWGSEEERLRTYNEIYDHGMYMPLIVLEKGFQHKGMDPSRFQTLDGNHRFDILKQLAEEGKIEDEVPVFIFPKECIDIRIKMTEIETTYKFMDIEEEIDIWIMPHAQSRMKIPRFKNMERSSLFVKVNLQNKLEIYNCALQIGHELTPHLYNYFKEHSKFPDKVEKTMFKVTKVDPLESNKIRVIYIEYDNICNRECAWCSNSVCKRTKYEAMNEKAFNDLLEDISRNRDCFSKDLMINAYKYNEVFYNPQLGVERLNHIKEMLPDVFVQTKTNGDLLSKEIFDSLKIDRLIIANYDCLCVEERMKRMKELGIRILRLEKSLSIIGVSKLGTQVVYRGDSIKHVTLQNRGGLIKGSFEYNGGQCSIYTIERDYPCKMVTKTVSIDYTGDVFLCFNLRSDIDDHKQHIVGNIIEQPLMDILSGDKAAEVRSLSTMSSNFPNACKECCSGTRKGRFE